MRRSGRHEEPGRSLRQRRSEISYHEDNPVLDELLGAEEPNKPVKNRKPDINALRRKVERACPATPFSAFVKPEEVLPTLQAEGFRRPLVVRAASKGSVSATRSGLSIRLPLRYLTPVGMIEAVGADHEVPTFDVATQDSGPRMTVKQLAEYFAVPPEERTRLVNVVSFSLSDTPLAVRIKSTFMMSKKTPRRW